MTTTMVIMVGVRSFDSTYATLAGYTNTKTPYYIENSMLHTVLAS